MVKTGVAAGDMKATVEALAGGESEGAAVAKTEADGEGPQEEEGVEGGAADDEDDDTPPREFDVLVFDVVGVVVVDAVCCLVLVRC